MKGSRWNAALLLGAVFVAGAATGAVGMQRYTAVTQPDRERGPEAYLDRLTRELSLDASQRTQVKDILDRYSPRMDALWAETRPRYEVMRTELRSDISALLTAEQRTRYQEMINRNEAARNARNARARQ